MRSLLFVSGISEQLILASRATAADGLVLDLADLVPPGQREAARTLVIQLLRELDFGDKELYVRINSLATDEGIEDARAIALSGASGIVVPKIEKADDAMLLARLLPQRVSRLLCMIETPRGVLESRYIASANSSIAGLIFGSSALTHALGCTLTAGEPELLFARSQVLLAARMAGVAAYDASPFAADNVADLRTHCRLMRHLGYDGHALVHPSHCETANECFAPTTT